MVKKMNKTIKEKLKKIFPKWILFCYRKISFLLKVFPFYFFRVCPIKNNKIVFSSYGGKGFGDNCKYIALELLNQKEKYDLVWLTNNIDDKNFSKRIRLVKYNSLKAKFELTTAKVWIDNIRKDFWNRKRKNQYYIQTWHGNLGPKKCEKDAESSLNKEYVDLAIHDSKMIDLCVSNGKHISDFYKRAFWYSGKVIECGSPRNDILINPKNYKNFVRKELGFTDEKICLYAPTFRIQNKTDMFSYKLNEIYNINYEMLKNSLEEKFGGKWKIAVRLHPNVSARFNELNLPEFVCNATNYPDSQELLSECDCVITDFSSIVYDFIFTKKPIFIYASDYEDYIKNQRQLNFQLEETPFSICKNNEELKKSILNFNLNEYQKNVNSFLKRFGVFENGNASKIIAEKIKEITGVKNVNE